MLFDYFKNGINLGGWLSQYDCLPKDYIPETIEERSEHFKTYITEKNIEQIKSWGLDHIRMPIDHRVLEEEENPIVMRKEAFYFMDLCMDWCEKHGLNIIIDLHHAQGNIPCAMSEPMPLLTEEPLINRFINIWKNIAKHYKDRKKPVIMFELLNEVSDGSGGYLWNELCRKTVSAIREIDSERFILIGSNEQNSTFRLQELNLFDDKNIFYNFHFYDPQVFTHQRAHFSEEMCVYNKVLPYPSDISDFTQFLLENREYLPKYNRVATDKTCDKEGTKRLLKGALNFVKYSGRELYCGEFGVIDTARDEDAVNWLKDCIEIFEENNIGHAFWNYKEMDFGFIDINNNIRSEKLLEGVVRG